MAIPPTYHDSDADDEYERSVLTSPILPTDDDTSPTDSDPPSTEPTPTTFGHKMDLSPGNTIVAWTSRQCADYIQSLSLPQYMDKFLDNDIVGEALIALRHEELKEMNIMSIGHRLTILKGVYDIKIKQGIPIDSDHWIPPSAEASEQDQRATRDDISRIIQSMEIRDHKIRDLEASIIRISEEYRKLRDEALPILRQAKALPYPPGSQSPDHIEKEERSPGVTQLPDPKSGLSRKFSAKRLWLGNPPKSSSPTHIMSQSIPEGRQLTDPHLDPSPAAREASNHLSANPPNSGSQPSTSPNQANIPSPTSPYTTAPSPYRGYRQAETSSATTVSNYDDRGRGNPTPTPDSSRSQTQPSRSHTYKYQPQQQSSSSQQQTPQDEPPPSGGGSGSSVEIFKSFRVSMEDPCEKVLPAALKKYNINADWKNYALYIVYGDQERCLGLKEKPLILFKHLDKEGRKPMFMLRRHAAPLEGHSGPSGGGGAMGMGPYDSNSGLGGGRGHASSIQLAGGVL